MCDKLITFPVSSIFIKFGEFYQEAKYSDVSILVEGRIFKCHRILLAAASSYFNSMFCGNFRESYTKKFVLHEVDAESFEQVLLSLYSGELTITRVNVFNLLRISEFLGMKSVQDACVEYILSHKYIMENVIEIFVWACTLNFLPLIDPLLKCIADGFIRLSESVAFLEMPFDDLHAVLTDRPIQLRAFFRRDDLFVDALIRWLHHSYTERKDCVEILDAIIPSVEISVEYSEFLLRKYKMNYPIPEKQDSSKDESFLKTFIKRYDGCYLNPDLLSASFSNNQFSKSPLSIHLYVGRTVISMNRYKPDGFISHVRDRSLTADGIQGLITSRNLNKLYCLKKQDHSSRTLFAYSSSIHFSESNLRNLCPPPVFSRFGSGVLHEESNSIFIAFHRGRTTRNRMYSTNYRVFNDEEIGRRIFHYRCELDEWFPVSQIRKAESSNFQLISNNNLVYWFSNDGSIQAYDVRSSECFLLPTRSQHGYTDSNCCVLDDKIYVSHLYNMEILDLTAQKWETVNYSFGEDFSYLINKQMVTYENMLWLFGIVVDYLNSETKRYEWNIPIQVYDPKTGEWYSSYSSFVHNTLSMFGQKSCTLENAIVFDVA